MVVHLCNGHVLYVMVAVDLMDFSPFALRSTAGGRDGNSSAIASYIPAVYLDFYA